MKFDAGKPLYQQIADIIIDNILVKKWSEEERIPSVREYAVVMEVNPNTILKVYDYLERADIIYKKRGIGYFIKENAYQTIMTMKKEQFIKKTIPDFIKNMKLLEVSIKEFETIYQEYNLDS